MPGYRQQYNLTDMTGKYICDTNEHFFSYGISRARLDPAHFPGLPAKLRHLRIAGGLTFGELLPYGTESRA